MSSFVRDRSIQEDAPGGAADGAPSGGTIEAAGGTVIWLVAHDGARLRLAHWSKGDRGVVLLLNGRTEFIEKYLETIAALQARGFAVWTLDWRGQGASTRPLRDPLAHHITHFDAYLGDLSQMVDLHVVPSLAQRPLVLFAHSMGGLIGAHMLSRRGILFARAILCAPMIDFLRGGLAMRGAARLLVHAVCLLPGRSTRFGPGMARLGRAERPFEGNRITTCAVRYEQDLDALRATPALALGGVTWGWLRAAMASVALMRDPRVMARIDMHVLVAMAGDETVVDNRAIRRFALRLPRGKVVVIAGARHELLRESDANRALLWTAIDTFLEPLDA